MIGKLQNLPSWIFRIQIDCVDLLSSFSKYTPANPEEKEAVRTARRPINLVPTALSLDSEAAVPPEGHCVAIKQISLYFALFIY